MSCLAVLFTIILFNMEEDIVKLSYVPSGNVDLYNSLQNDLVIFMKSLEMLILFEQVNPLLGMSSGMQQELST